jgi:hypothetical protein
VLGGGDHRRIVRVEARDADPRRRLSRGALEERRGGILGTAAAGRAQTLFLGELFGRGSRRDAGRAAESHVAMLARFSGTSMLGLPGRPATTGSALAADARQRAGRSSDVWAVTQSPATLGVSGDDAMPTNLDLDDKLIDQARRVGHHRTKKDAVTAALREYVKHHERLRIVELFGTIDFDPAWDHKAARRARAR